MKKLGRILRHEEKGFTLIELIVVIAILGILAAIAVPQYMGTINNAKQKADQATAQTIADASARYISDNCKYNNGLVDNNSSAGVISGSGSTITINIANLVTAKYLDSTPSGFTATVTLNSDNSGGTVKVIKDNISATRAFELVNQ